MTNINSQSRFTIGSFCLHATLFSACSLNSPSANADRPLRAFGKLTMRHLEHIESANLQEIDAYLQKLGLSTDTIKERFLNCADRCLSTDEGVRSPDFTPQDRVDLLFGVRFLEISRDSSAKQILKSLAVHESVTQRTRYASMLALNALGSELPWLLAAMDHPNSDVSQFAILTVATHEVPTIEQRLADIEASRAKDREVVYAVQIARMSRDVINKWKALETFDERINLVGRHMGRQFSMLTGKRSSFYDPWKGGHPLARWALREWKKLCMEDPERTAAYMAATSMYAEVEQTRKRYQRFLAQEATDAVRAKLKGVVE